MGGEAGLGLDLFSGLLKAGYGSWELIQGLKGLRNLKRPEYSVDPSIKLNQQLAGQYSSQGYGSQFLNLAGDSIDRNLGSSIEAYKETGQGLNTINNAVTNSNSSFQSLLMADAMQKSRNRQTLLDANKDLAEENLRSFNWNRAIPYEQDFTKFTNQTNSGAQNLFGGTKGIGADLSTGEFDSSGFGNKNSQDDMFRAFQKWYQSQQGGFGSGDYSGNMNFNNYG